MKLVDRYILRQLTGPFIFFLVIFVGILWLNQALKIIDIVVENGQPGAVFVELSAYLLPRVIESVFPVAAFASALYLTNQLYTESEYVVLQAAGQSPFAFARPFLVFGVICFCLVSVLAHFVTPKSNSAFQQRQHQITQEYLSQLIKEGEFIAANKNVTFYFGTVNEGGYLEDIIIREQKNDDEQVIHTAPTGYIVEKEEENNLVLLNGTTEQYSITTKLLSVVQFDSASYNLDQFAKKVGARRESISEIDTFDLPWSIAKASEENIAKAVEANARLVKAMFSLLMPLLGAAILFSGSFSRSGFFYRIACAIVLLFGLNTMRGATEGYVINNPQHYYMLYSPVALSALIILILVWITANGLYLKNTFSFKPMRPA